MNQFKKNNTSKRHGLSLLEVLVGLTITLIVLLAMTQAFRFASQQMSIGRASVELTNRLRTAESLLRNDLDRLTVVPRSFHSAAAEPKGYFELVDGFATDTNNFINTFVSPPTNATVVSDMQEISIRSLAMGDHDDLWCGTIRSDSQPFRGRNGTEVEESHLAEVIWYTAANDLDDNTFIEVTERVNLFRRVLLVKPNTAILRTDGTPMGPFANLVDAIRARSQYLQSSDISVSVRGPVGGQFEVVANSLESLTVRSNRFFTATHGMIAGANETEQRLNYRDGLRYLKRIDYGSQADFENAQELRLRSLDNQNLLLNDVLAFDIQVFDPSALVGVSNDGTANIQNSVEPSDVGSDPFSGLTSFLMEGTTIMPPLGGFVDLGKTTGFGAGQFGAAGNNRLRFIDQVYDTGTPLYDRNNIDDSVPLNGLIDEGGDGIDNDSDGLIDEVDEKEVPPNFVDPIKGLSIRIRLLEPASGQISQATIKKSF